MKWKSLILAGVIASTISVTAEKVEIKKNDVWKLNKSWISKDGALIGSSKGTAFVPLKNKVVFKEVEFKAAITPVKVIGASWKVAGIQIKLAGDKFWQLALIERPDKHKYAKSHFIELKEKLGKVWGAESKLKRLVLKTANFKWQYGKTYKLTLKVTNARIDGYVADADGKQIFHAAYQLTGNAVTGGSPVLRVTDIEAKFADLELVGEK